MKLFIGALLLIAAAAVSASSQTTGCDTAIARLNDTQNQLKDWPQLRRYKEENARLAPPRSGEERVVFIGDSITDLWDDPGFGGFFTGRPYVNRGISGQTTPQMLLRFRPDVVELRPKVVVILAGTNDIAGNTGPMTLEEIGRNIASMAELAQANGIKVVLASVLPVSDTVPKEGGGHFVRTTSRPPAKIIELNRWLRGYAAQNGHIYLDYYTEMADGKGFVKAGLTYDGLHPNSTGYKIMVELATRAVERTLRKRG